MDFTLSEEQKAVREQIIRFAQEELTPGSLERDEGHVFSKDLWLKCGDMGLQGLPVPAEFGGAGLDPLTTVVALEALGYGCEDGGLVFSICAHLLACVVPIWQHGSEAQKAHYLPQLCKGRVIAVNAMTEPESGSDAFAMKTRAKWDGADFVVNGVKTFGSNGPVADLAVLYALTDPDKGYHGGVTAFAVPADTPGFSRGRPFKKMGLRTAPIGELIFENVRLPAGAVLGTVGAGGPIFNQSMEWERTCLVAAHLGAMERQLEKAVDYARTRKSFGQRISHYQSVSHRIADMKVRLEAARLLTYRAAMRLETSRAVGLDAAMAKLFVSESLVETAFDMVRILGGYGYMAEFGAERVLRDSIAGLLYSGTNEMQKNIIARWLGL
jgi:alkylation response protein AidB-like acyl-CoA dehydrogenase